MKHIITIFFISIFIGGIHKAQAQKTEHKVWGKIGDKVTRKPLEGATIYIDNLKIGAVSNDKGEYILNVPSGQHTFVVSYLGYITSRAVLNINGPSNHNFYLIDNNELKEIVITSESARDNITAPVVGLEKLTGREIKKIPAMMGEVDVIKAIQLLPGVQSTSDGGSGFSVRGSAPDQNLILFDNSTIYNASHLLGIFSVFNNDVVQGIELYKGDIPVKHGGRMASLLDVQTKNTLPERFTMTGGLGLISSRLTIESPIGNKTSVLLGGRRSYADLFLKLLEDYKHTSLYFYDLNGKITHAFSPKSRLELNAYTGKDNYGVETQKFDYRNTAASATYSYNFSTGFYSRFSFNFSDYRFGLYSKMKNNELSWVSSITDYTLRADFSSFITPLFNLTYGASATYHNFRPGIVKNPTIQDFKIDHQKSVECSAYLSNEQDFTDNFKLKYGLRFTAFNNVGRSTVYFYDNDYEVADSTVYGKGKIYNTYYAWEPRIAFVWKFNENSSVKGAFVHNEQFIQLANNSAAGTPMDIWFTAGKNIKPQNLEMYSLGYFRNFNDDIYETSVEVYYKQMRNVIDFADHAQLELNKYLDGEIRSGKGRAYGVELMVRKNRGKLNGFANYTLSRSERKIPEINNGKTYLAPFDKTHCFNIAANYEFSKKYMLSATWIYATGMPTTYPVGRFEINGEYFPIYSERNEYRRPDYQRLDLAFTYTPKPESSKRFKGEWVFSVFNAYNKKNAWTISYDQKDGGTPYAEMVYLFGILPSVTYNFRF